MNIHQLASDDDGVEGGAMRIVRLNDVIIRILTLIKVSVAGWTNAPIIPNAKLIDAVEEHPSANDVLNEYPHRTMV